LVAERAAVIALQRQLSLVASDTDDADVVEHASSAVASDVSPGSNRPRRRTVTSATSNKTPDDRAVSAAEKKPLMPSNQLIKDEDVVEGMVCQMFCSSYHHRMRRQLTNRNYEE